MVQGKADVTQALASHSYNMASKACGVRKVKKAGFIITQHGEQNFSRLSLPQQKGMRNSW